MVPYVVLAGLALASVAGIMIVATALAWERGYRRGLDDGANQIMNRVWGGYAHKDEPFRCRAVPLEPPSFRVIK